MLSCNLAADLTEEPDGLLDAYLMVSLFPVPHPNLAVPREFIYPEVDFPEGFPNNLMDSSQCFSNEDILWPFIRIISLLLK